MSGLLNEVQRIISELNSSKAPSRNKAIEQLDQKLNSSKDALNAILSKKQEISWQDVFKAAKDAIFKHAEDLQASREKTQKTLMNKCYLYGNVVDKIIDYNLEMGRGRSGHFLAKSSIFNAFEEGIRQSHVVRHFGVNFLNMLDRGIYMSPRYILDLKVSEYSRILSYLFELNIDNDEFLRSKILKCITKTVQLAQQRVQLHADLVDYLPTLSSYAQKANTAERKSEIVRLYHIFVSELSLNYHHELCIHMQEILPKLCDYHNDDTFRDDTKNIFFESVLLSLHTLYPKLHSNDFSTFQVPMHGSWAQTMQKLRTITQMEIRNNSTGRNKVAQLSSDKFPENFIKMSALILYIILWNLDVSKPSSNTEEAPSKRARVDKLESVINLIDKQETSFNDVWFAIFAELLQLSDAIISVGNYQQTLQITLDVLLIYDNGRNLHNVRLCLTSLLAKEQQLLQTHAIPDDYLPALWHKIGSHLISETRSSADIIAEKQIILQSMIRHKKLKPALCGTLINSITTIDVLRRSECISTLREIFIYAQHCGLNKATSELEPIINWAYGSEKIKATQMIHNIAAIDAKLLADTFCIGIINFLDERQESEQMESTSASMSAVNLQLLQYKYNKKLICLEPEFQAQLSPCTDRRQGEAAQSNAKNCLFQNNYELLMRMLNPSTTNEHTPSAILKDLKGLHKLVCTMERLLHYKVFDADNLLQCPLIKRIGLFLSHIEFHYKANQVERLDDSDLRDILQQQIAVLQVFNSHDILLQYLEKQPIEMLIEFIGALLKHNSTHKDAAAVEATVRSALTTQCFHILGCLCANSSYSSEAFRHISKNVKQHTSADDVLLITKLLCRCKSLTDECIGWLVDKLKDIIQHNFLDVDVVAQIVEHLPIVFKFVYQYEHLLDDMMTVLHSLLKLTLKKSYPTKLAVQIVQCVGQVARHCTNIFESENFVVICMSVAKFLTMPTLEVRFAALATLTLFFNTDFCVTDCDEDAVVRCDKHLDFCEQLYECIDWEKFTTSGQDLIQNSHAVTIQTLLALFAFSTYHQETTLRQLLNYCAQQSLKETEFGALACSVMPGKQETMRQLLLPYADTLLHQWTAQGLSISKFPYFLCFNSKEEFLKATSNSIMAYILIYGKPEHVERYNKHIDLEESLVILAAYQAIASSDCDESCSTDFRQHYGNLQKNLQQFQLDPACVPLNAMTLYITIGLMLDKSELARLFGSTVSCNRSPAWYNISSESLYISLCQLVSGGRTWSQQKRLQSMSVLILEQPLVLIELLDKLKSDCHLAQLSSHILRCFFLYASIVDAILDAVKLLEDESSLVNDQLLEINCVYFVRDIWFFVCRLLLHSNCTLLHRAVLEFLQTMLSKSSAQAHCLSAAHADELATLFVAAVRHMESRELKQTAAAILEQFIDVHKKQVNLETLLDEASECEYLNPLRQQLIDDPKLPKFVDLGAADYIRAFLKPNRLERLHGLREYLAENKNVLQSHEQLLFELISRLIRMVRESPKQEGSLDALKCLAQIGPLKMQHISYYFQTDFDAFEQNVDEPMEQFLSIVMESLEKHWFDFNTSTQDALVEVAGHVMNSKAGVKLSDKFTNLRIFHRKQKKTNFLNSGSSIPDIDWLGILQSCDRLDYEPWLCAFMSRVYKACGWPGFDELALKSLSFAKVSMQPFIKLLLANKDEHLDSLCGMLNHFFELSCSNTPTVDKCIYQEKRAIKRMLHMCECIRVVNNWKIPLKLSNVIMASNHCQAYFLSIMYLELWACSTSGVPNGSILQDECFQVSAKKAYESIGCLDAIPGFLNPLRSRVAYLSLENNLSGILLESDSMDMTNSQLCVDIMKSNGMLSFAALHQRQQKILHDQKDVDYEILWRLGQWDEPVDVYQKVDHSGNMEIEFQKHHYMALKSICNREEENTLSAMNNAYHCVLDILRDISVECLQSVYKYMTWLGTLQQVEDFCQIQFSQQLSATQIKETFDKWQTELDLSYGHFNCKEHILSHQIVLFKMAGTRADRRIQQYYKQSPVDTYLLKSIGECKDAGKLNLATKYIAALRGQTNIKEPTKISVLLEDADVNVKTCNYQIAKAILQHVVTNPEFQFCLQRVPAMRMQGEFLLNCNAQSFSHVLEHNFQGSLTLLDQFKSRQAQLMKSFPDIFTWSNFDTFENHNRKAAHAAIAKFADREYQQLHDYRNSQEYHMIADIIQQNRRLANTVDNKKSDRDVRVGAINLNRFAQLDENQLQRIEDNLTEYLCTAIKHHIAYCQLDSGFSSAAMYRIIALWFTNAQNAKMLEQIKDGIGNVPSYKFICAVNQLAGRLNSKNAEFHKVLVDLLVRCGQDHPQQTFYKLYPLVYAHMDGNNSNTQRADIAKKIIAQICAANAAVQHCSTQFEAMFPALINFANTYLVTDPNGRPSGKGIPDKLKKLNALKMNLVHCPTLELAVQPNKDYKLITIEKWKTEGIFLCSGLNAPVKVLCLCSDGVVRAQLIKGKDDLRQDAVMQQVFGIVNELLNSDAEFIERRLQLRTYKVTPLSMRSGILEWCNNTIPVGVYLVGNGTQGAHMKYRPNDWNNKKCREMSNAALRKAAWVRKKIYTEICEHVKPVFHYFLLEKFPIPGIWFERRLAYVNSVATTSMVGYVLGLGDRHTQNILIDEQTAEVVHIDFGIAFEQGKIQTTPETVPFRLTRDFVAPMGVCGTNGVFSKSCEAIMHILRRYRSVLTTILEVLLYDPLFIWGVLSKDSSNEESKNLLAQRALLLVQYKLEGREPGLLDVSSVEAQVQRLINEATLPGNLAMLYPGWDPYL